VGFFGAAIELWLRGTTERAYATVRGLEKLRESDRTLWGV
jgi:hypothetical protein